MMPELRFAELSASTRSNAGHREASYTSGATRALAGPADTLVVGARPTARHATAGWRSVVIATMLPFASIDDVIFRRRLDAATMSGYVIYLGEEHELEAPSVVAVWPDRQTFRFRVRRPARRLPPRLPFIGTASSAEDE